MSSGNARQSRSSWPSVLGKDGTIDLTSQRNAGPLEHPHGGSSAQTVVPELSREIADRFALGDYAEALGAAELQLGLDPADEEARRYAAESRQRLEARYIAQIGSLDSVFNHGVSPAKVKWLGLDPQAAVLLARVDGETTLDEVLALVPLGRLEALRLFIELLDAKAIIRVS